MCCLSVDIGVACRGGVPRAQLRVVGRVLAVVVAPGARAGVVGTGGASRWNGTLKNTK